MRRTVIIASLAASASIAPMGAQTRPDFSGTWTHVSSVPEGLRALGDDFTITQNASAFTLEVRSFMISGSVSAAGATSTKTPTTSRYTHALDGGEHPLVPVFDPAMPANPARIQNSVSKALWAGPQLLVMTYRRDLPGRTDREHRMPAPVRSLYKRR